MKAWCRCLASTAVKLHPVLAELMLFSVIESSCLMPSSPDHCCMLPGTYLWLATSKLHACVPQAHTSLLHSCCILHTKVCILKKILGSQHVHHESDHPSACAVYQLHANDLEIQLITCHLSNDANVAMLQHWGSQCQQHYICTAYARAYRFLHYTAH